MGEVCIGIKLFLIISEQPLLVSSTMPIGYFNIADIIMIDGVSEGRTIKEILHRISSQAGDKR